MRRVLSDEQACVLVSHYVKASVVSGRGLLILLPSWFRDMYKADRYTCFSHYVKASVVSGQGLFILLPHMFWFPIMSRRVLCRAEVFSFYCRRGFKDMYKADRYILFLSLCQSECGVGPRSSHSTAAEVLRTGTKLTSVFLYFPQCQDECGAVPRSSHSLAAEFLWTCTKLTREMCPVR